MNDKLDVSLKRADIALKKAEVKEKVHNLPLEKLRVGNDSEKIKVEKIDCLKGLLQSLTVDPDATLFNSEPKIVPVFNGTESGEIKAKIFEIIKTL